MSIHSLGYIHVRSVELVDGVYYSLCYRYVPQISRITTPRKFWFDKSEVVVVIDEIKWIHLVSRNGIHFYEIGHYNQFDDDGVHLRLQDIVQAMSVHRKNSVEWNLIPLPQTTYYFTDFGNRRDVRLISELTHESTEIPRTGPYR